MKKVIVITGGSDGLGRALAESLSKENQVIILSPTKEKLEAVASDCACDYKVADVSKHEEISRAVDSILQKYGRVDCLINNAGIWIQGKIEDNDYQKIQDVLDINTVGTIFATKAIVPTMKQQKSGMIINVISQAGIYAKAERAVYNASKWAITGFTKSIQPELSPFGIKVTGLYPGMMKTKMFEKLEIEKDMSTGIDVAEVVKSVEFLLSLNDASVVPELGIKHIDG